MKQNYQNLNIRKAPGWDEIGNIASQNFRDAGCNTSTEALPADWKRTEVILFPKPQKDPLFPQNYRPISFLPSLGRVAKVIILRRLKVQEEDVHVIPDEQFGFRRTLSKSWGWPSTSRKNSTGKKRQESCW